MNRKRTTPKAVNAPKGGHPPKRRVSAEKKVVRRLVPDSERKEKPIMVRVSSDEHKNYIELSEKTGIPLAEPSRRGLDIWHRSGGKLPSYRVPVKGYIPAGPADNVLPLPDSDVAVDDGFAQFLQGDEYFLVVSGDSMTSERFDSIEPGSYALFRHGLDPVGRICHIEWPDSQGEHVCTLKRLLENGDGTYTLKPSNPRHKSILKARHEFEVRGVYLKSYKPVSPEAEATCG